MTIHTTSANIIGKKKLVPVKRAGNAHNRLYYTRSVNEEKVHHPITFLYHAKNASNHVRPHQKKAKALCARRLNNV
jgi:hypothetical protein